MFLYDTHVHSSEASACGKSTARELVRAYKEAGYSGFALTNHFYHGNSGSNREGTWREFIQPYFDAYYEACDEGAKLGFDVIFGIEEGVGNSKEFLCYNMDMDFLLTCEELRNADRKQFTELIHSAGGIIIHAHPFRFAQYMKAYYEPDFEGCDGIEVFNGNNRPEDANDKALAAALALSQERKMILTAGSDCHNCAWVSKVGLLLPHRVRNAAEFVEVLKSESYELKTE